MPYAPVRRRPRNIFGDVLYGSAGGARDRGGGGGGPMTMFKRPLLNWLFGVICACAVLWVTLPIKPFQDCIKERKEYQTYHPLREKIFFPITQRIRIRLNLECAVHTAGVYQDALVGLSGVAVALFTFALWVSTHRLWKAGERQLEIAEKAANAAATSVDIAMAGQRAFVQVTPSWSSDRTVVIGTDMPQYNFGTRMDNIGNTTASDLRNYINCVFLSGEMPDDFRFPDDADPIAQGGILGAKQWLLGPHVPSDRYITAEEMIRIQREEVRLYFFGMGSIS
jgi:hypothetical protein